MRYFDPKILFNAAFAELLPKLSLLKKFCQQSPAGNRCRLWVIFHMILRSSENRTSAKSRFK